MYKCCKFLFIRFRHSSQYGVFRVQEDSSFVKPRKDSPKYQVLNRTTSKLNKTDLISPDDQRSIQIELASGESTIRSCSTSLRRRRVKVYNLKGNSITLTHHSDADFSTGRNTLIKIRRNSEILEPERIRVIKKSVTEIIQLRDTIITDNCII